VLLEVDHAVADGGAAAFFFPATWAITISQSFAIRRRRRPATTCSSNRLTAIVCMIRKIRRVALARIINDAAQRQAPVLIPAFAVGRTQEIVYLIRELEDEKAIPILPVTVDSPMAAATTTAYANRKEEQDEEYASILTQQRHPLRTHSMSTASSRQESKRLNDAQGARVIISASGMMTGGRVLHHALRLVPDPETTIVFVGYQAAGTTGRRILDGRAGSKNSGTVGSGALSHRKDRRLLRAR
jgi:predicted metal-dependent RNase